MRDYPALVIVFPPTLARRIIVTHGDAGRDWLEFAPSRMSALAAAHGFEIHPPFDDLSYAYVAPVTLADGQSAVLKAQPPHDESRSELAALAAWGGEGAVRVLWADADAGLALLDRVIPGATLESLDDDDEATRIAARVMARLWVGPPPDPALIHLAHWGGAFQRHRDAHPSVGPLPSDLVSAAVTTWDALLASSPEPRLLHGDLHHGNILNATGDDWLAIDPKGVVGDPAFEPSALFFNPHDRVAACRDITALVAHRLDILAATLPLDRTRIAAWGFARTVLSMCWTVEDGATLRLWMLDVAAALRRLAGR